MKLAEHRQLDALCAEYLLGTLRGGARRRFERALQKEPLVALRLRHWQATATPRYSARIEVPPPAHLWRGLQRDLGLHRYRQPWYRRSAFWQAWAGVATAATAALLVLLVLPGRNPVPVAPPSSEIARLSGSAGTALVVAQRSADGRTLVLKANRPVLAGPNQSYELWLIPPGRAPVSLAVLGNLDATIVLAQTSAEALRAGATLAISTEPAGGSPTGQPTGAVILAGQVNA
jgi:anti-sigma-K factor RskA